MGFAVLFLAQDDGQVDSTIPFVHKWAGLTLKSSLALATRPTDGDRFLQDHRQKDLIFPCSGQGKLGQVTDGHRQLVVAGIAPVS